MVSIFGEISVKNKSDNKISKTARKMGVFFGKNALLQPFLRSC